MSGKKAWIFRAKLSEDPPILLSSTAGPQWRGICDILYNRAGTTRDSGTLDVLISLILWYYSTLPTILQRRFGLDDTSCLEAGEPRTGQTTAPTDRSKQHRGFGRIKRGAYLALWLDY